MMKEINSKYDIIRNFSPAWFSSVMGTGILALTSLSYSQYLPVLSSVASFLFYFNILLFAVFLVPWTLRWFLYRKEALADLEHPVMSNFYATIAAAMIVLASDFIVIGKELLIGGLFWFIGTLSTVFFAVLTPYILFKREHVKIDHINPAWFIPPVALIVIPVAGGPIARNFSGLMGEFVTLLNYFGLGAGFFMYVSLLAISMYRFILHHPLPNTLAPTIWINLGPIGVGTIAITSLVNTSTFISVKEPFLVLGFLLWGFGIWWLMIAIAITMHYIKRLRLPYSMSWWAFTFPLGAYVAASHSVYESFNIALVDYIGFALFWLLLALWSITLFHTIRGAYSGMLFRGQP